VLALVRSSAEGEGFVPPSTKDFELPPIFGDNPYTTKPIFLVLLSVSQPHVKQQLFPQSFNLPEKAFMHLSAMTLLKM
jgi:hypothetical protein